MKPVVTILITYLFIYFNASIAFIPNINIINDPKPRFGNIRLSSINTPLHGTTITWSNTNNRTDSLRWGYTKNLEEGTHVGVKENNYGKGLLFHYTFPDLEPESMIYYQLFNSRKKKWTNTKLFQTAKSPGSKTFTFIAAGDSRHHSRNWRMVANSMKKADFVLFTGDLVNDGNKGKYWEDWFKQGKIMNENMVVYHTYGNHDGTYENFTRQFVLPGNERYYSFNYGNALFICLDSDDPENPDQLDWLRKTLIKNQEQTWKIVFFHKPFYTCGGHEYDMHPYYNTWWKIFDNHGVDLILNGHAHNYQRAFPINRNSDTLAPVLVYGSKAGQGRCQVVTGGAGAPLYRINPSIWFANVQTVNHHCRIDVQGKSLRLRATKTDGSLIDDFTLSKDTLDTSDNLFTENAAIKDIKLLKTPSENNLEITVNTTPKDDVTIIIYDKDGNTKIKKLFNKVPSNFKYTYDTSSLPEGHYYLQVKWQKRMVTETFEIKK